MAINDVTRSLGPSESQSHTTEAIGHAEDYSDIIVNISPEVTFFLSRMGEAEDATSLKFGWTTEGIDPPGINAHLEKEDYGSHKVGSLRHAENNCQFFINDGYVTEAQRKVAKVYNPQDEKVRLLKNVLRKHARDIEFAIVTNSTTNAESGNTAALTGGIPYFLQSNRIDCTIDSNGIVTTTEEHYLVTGDFVYFSASTMPDGLEANEAYYIRVDDTNPKTAFTIFNTMNDAVRNITDNQVIPSTTTDTLQIEINNIVDLGGKSDFTLDDLDKAMEMAYNRGGNPTLAVMSPAKKRIFSKLITAATTINRNMKGDRKIDLVAAAVETDYGTLTAETHRLYPFDRIDLMDMDYWDLKWFERTHEVTGLPKVGTYDSFVVQAWLGVKGTQPLASAAITGIKR